MDYGSLSISRRGADEMTVPLGLGAIMIGSDPSCAVIVGGPGVGRLHARLISTPDACILSDLDSPGGTFVNRVRLARGMPSRLQDGDEIRIGDAVIRYHAPKKAEATASEAAAQGTPPAPAPTQGPQRAVPPPDVARAAQAAQAARRAGRPVTRLPGNRGPGRIPPGQRQLSYDASDYVAMLPPPYQGDPFMYDFMAIFKSILDPLDRLISQIYYYFDPRLVPEPLLPWLATWVDLVLNENWPIERRRALVASAAHLYRWRGTRLGMSDYIRIYTGFKPRIVEPGQEQRDKGEPPLAPHTFRVILEVPDPTQIDRDLVEQIIETEKPAHTAYALEIRRAA